jgi:hypothetical protein
MRPFGSLASLRPLEASTDPWAAAARSAPPVAEALLNAATRTAKIPQGDTRPLHVKNRRASRLRKRRQLRLGTQAAH